jgi:hypothetical protein
VLTMKARWFVILATFSLLTLANASAQDIAPANVTYDKIGNFVWVTGTFLVECSGRCAKQLVMLTLQCPTGYVAIGGGYRNIYTDAHRIGKHLEAPYNVWADEPMKDRTGWLIGMEKDFGYRQEMRMTVTCAEAGQ